MGTVNDEAVFAELDSLAAHERGADTPFQSFSTSQGTCVDRSAPAFGTVYNFIVCELGALAPGASAQITATVKVNQSAVFSSYLLPNAFEGGYTDADNSNNSDSARVTASTPPVISGSQKIKITRPADGLRTWQFHLPCGRESARREENEGGALLLGRRRRRDLDEEGERQPLKATVPVSMLYIELEKVYKLEIKAKRRGGKPPLITT